MLGKWLGRLECGEAQVSGLGSDGGCMAVAGERGGRAVSKGNGEAEEEGCITGDWASPISKVAKSVKGAATRPGRKVSPYMMHIIHIKTNKFCIY